MSTSRDGHASGRLESFGPLAVLVVVSAFGVWRATLGFDLRDSAYVTAIAQRVARGEIPFVDELNPHVFGSAPLAPVLWAWQNVAGMTGSLLVGRLTFVALAGVAGVIAWRALSPHVGPMVSAVAVATAVLALPYNLFVVSYNTVPQLALMVATSAAVGAVVRGSRWWAVVCGASAVVASVGYFAVLPASASLVGAAVMGRWVWTGRRPARDWMLHLVGAALAVGLTFILWISLVPGWTAVKESYDLLDSGAGERGIGPARFHAHFVMGARLLPLALCLGIASALVTRWTRLSAVLLAGAVALVALWGGEFGQPGQEPTLGHYAGAVVLALTVVLVPVVAVELARSRNRLLRLVALVAVPPAIVGAVATSAVTLSGAAYGAYAVPMSGVVILSVMAIAVRTAGDGAPMWSRPVFLLPGVVMVASLCAVVFNEGPVTTTSIRLTAGPGAGLLVGEDSAADHAAVARLVAACPEPRSGVWAPGVPGAYLWVDEPSRVPQYWLSPHEFESGLSVLTTKGVEPACVLAPADLSAGAPGEPLAEWLRDGYRASRTEHLRTVGERGTRYALYQRLPERTG